MSKIRINELARELEVKASQILDMLPELGVIEKKTHSSSVDEDVAVKLRQFLGQSDEPGLPRELREVGAENGPEEPSPRPAAERPPPAPAAEKTISMPEQVATQGGLPPKVEKFKASPSLDLEEPPVSQGLPIRPPVGAARPPLAVGRGLPLKPPMRTGKEGTVAPRSNAPASPGAPAGASVRVPPSIPLPPSAPGEPVKRQPIRPVLKTPATPGERPVIPAKPLPTAPQPGEILSGPRQPLPPLPKPAVTPGTPIAPRPVAPGTPLPRPQAPPPERPGAPYMVAPGAPVEARAEAPSSSAAEEAGRPLAGQPSARPVVPPRPDLVAKILRQRMGPAAQPKPGIPKRPSGPLPGQPIYRGPIRPGQTMPGRGPSPQARRGAPGAPMAPDVAQPPRPGDQRRPPDKRRQVRKEEPEEKNLLRRPKSFYEDTSHLADGKVVAISEGITVKELAEKLGLKASQVIKKLVERKIFATINQTLEAKVAEDVATSFGAKPTQMSYEEETVQEVQSAELEQDRLPRAPVVTVMGHVDHGKTSLLDAIRQTNVADREAGGITQHIGAYKVDKDGRAVVFVDTPGHEAFTRMRARGAKVTDIVILVVAADDGVMPQTLEAIDHARAASVPILVAVNKIDRPDANPERVKQQLADRGLLPEEWGGETIMVPVSAKSGQNLDLLLEMVLLVADVQDLKANPERLAEGTVLEAKLDRGRGPVATLLVRNGTLRVGDHFICGSVFGKVRAMFDDRGDAIKEAGPATPVEVLGLENVPEVGDILQVVTDIAKAKQVVMFRESRAREVALSKTSRLTLDRLHDQLRAGEVKELPVIVKADVGGSAEVLAETLQKLSTEKVQIRVISTGVGAITESDVLLASASNAIIIGFGVRPERNAAALAEEEGVDIRLHTIIYELTGELKKAMTGLLEPVRREVYKGRAEVREVFRISKVGVVAGCGVLDGVITRQCEIRVLRDNVVIFTGRIGSLKRFKDDVSEVKSGMECGIAVANFSDVKPGDILEAFITEQVAAEA